MDRGAVAKNYVNTEYANGLGQSVAKPRTISSAIGRIDAANDRLAGIVGQLAQVADQIGGPRPTSNEARGVSPIVEGAVGRLNDSADRTHDQLDDIEALLTTIGRALG